MTFFSFRPILSVFCLSLLSEIIYDPFLTKNLYFIKNLFDTFLKVSWYFSTLTITLLLEILGGHMHGSSLHLKFFWGRLP